MTYEEAEKGLRLSCHECGGTGRITREVGPCSTVTWEEKCGACLASPAKVLYFAGLSGDPCDLRPARRRAEDRIRKDPKALFRAIQAIG